MPLNDSSETSLSRRRKDYTQLVLRIRAGDRRAVDDLCQTFQAGMRFLIARCANPQDIGDILNDALVAVVGAITNDAVREPKRLPRYVCEACASRRESRAPR